MVCIREHITMRHNYHSYPVYSECGAAGYSKQLLIIVVFFNQENMRRIGMGFMKYKRLNNTFVMFSSLIEKRHTSRQ